MALLVLALMAATGLLGGLGRLADAHSYHGGSCPQVRPMRDFEMEKFLGRWYVMQKSKTRVKCLIHEYSAADIDDGHDVHLVQKMQVPVPGVNNGVRYSGRITVNDPASRPAAMRVDFPLNVLGSSSYDVLDTDYTSYALVFSCQNIAFWHRQSASIMSRSPTMSSSQIARLREVLKMEGINPNDLDTIPHSCDGRKEQGIQVNVMHDVFDKNTTSILKDAGSVAVAAADAAKTASDVYNTVNSVMNVVSDSRRRRSVADSAEKPDEDDDESNEVIEELLYWLP